MIPWRFRGDHHHCPTLTAGGAARETSDEQPLLAAETAVDIGAHTPWQGRSHIGALIGRDFATDVDLQIETAIKASLARDTPEIPFLGEEEGGGGAAGEPCWVLDPIDGTINFARDSPLCAISLSLVVGGQPELGIVDAPLLGERFIARRGAGAYLNATAIAVAEVEVLHEAIVAMADFKVGPGPRRRTGFTWPRSHGWRTRACACGCTGPRRSISRGSRPGG